MRKMMLLIPLALFVVVMNCCKEPDDLIIMISPDDLSGEFVSSTATSAILSITAPDDALEVGVCWDSVWGPTIDDSHILVTVENGKATVEVIGLKVDQQYFAKVYAVGTDGQYIYSKEFRFKTCYISAGFKSSNIGLHEATLNGYVMIFDGMTEVKFHFEYGEIAACEFSTPDSSLSGSGKTEFISHLEDLKFGQNYFVRLVVTINGEAKTFEGESFKTLGGLASVSNIHFDNSEYGRVTLYATVNSNHLLTKVGFEFGETPDYGGIINVGKFNSSAEDVFTVIDLPEPTGCHFRIHLNNEAGEFITADTVVPSLAFTDREGNVFYSVKIGDHIWLTSNWRIKTYNNGDAIPYITEDAEWVNAKTGAMCYYNNDPENYKIYGALYNWWVIEDPRGICPSGWRVPTDKEISAMGRTLPVEVYGIHNCGGLKETGNNHWFPSNTGATNSTGFTALPAGSRAQFEADPSALGVFGDINQFAYFWSSEKYGPDIAWGSHLYGQTTQLYSGRGVPKYYGRSIRLIKE